MSDPNRFIADFETQGEAAVRHWVNTASPLEVDQVVLRHAVAWLKEKESERSLVSSVQPGKVAKHLPAFAKWLLGIATAVGTAVLIKWLTG